MTEIVIVNEYDEEGNPTPVEVEKFVTTPVEVDEVAEDGTVTKVTVLEPVLDPQYIETEVPQGFYWPMWDGTGWVEGGQAPEPPTEVVLTTDQKLDQMAAQMVITQGELDAAQEALDFLLMGGM